MKQRLLRAFSKRISVIFAFFLSAITAFGVPAAETLPVLNVESQSTVQQPISQQLPSNTAQLSGTLNPGEGTSQGGTKVQISLDTAPEFIDVRSNESFAVALTSTGEVITWSPQQPLTGKASGMSTPSLLTSDDFADEAVESIGLSGGTVYARTASDSVWQWDLADLSSAPKNIGNSKSIDELDEHDPDADLLQIEQGSVASNGTPVATLTAQQVGFGDEQSLDIEETENGTVLATTPKHSPGVVDVTITYTVEFLDQGADAHEAETPEFVTELDQSFEYHSADDESEPTHEHPQPEQSVKPQENSLLSTPEVTPLADNGFCAAHPNEVYSLRTNQNSVPSTNFTASIDRFTVDETSGGAQNINLSGNLLNQADVYSSLTVPTDEPEGWQWNYIQWINHGGAGVNSLGVSSNGVAYFTAHYVVRAQSKNVSIGLWRNRDFWREYVQVWEIDLSAENPAGTLKKAGNPYLTKNLRSEPSSWGDPFISGGAVNRQNGGFYFSAYDSLPDHKTQIRLWKYSPATSSVTPAGRYTVQNTAANAPDGVSGDIAFDGEGNLIFTVGGKTKAATGTITAEKLAQGEASPNTDITGVLVSGASSYTDVGNGPAGISYLPSGHLVWQTNKTENQPSPAGTGQMIEVRNPINHTRVASKLFSSQTNPRDLGGCQTPPTVEIHKHVVDRLDASDQFSVGMGSNVTSSTTMTTSGGDNGIQEQSIGPVPVLTGGTMNIRESLTTGSTTASLAQYKPTLSCINEVDGSALGKPRQMPEGSDGWFEIKNFPLEALGSSDPSQGPRIDCTVTNDPTAPTKSASPVVQTPVNEHSEVTYTLKFDNSSDRGRAPADLPVQHVDHLADVLDDADLTATPVVSGGTGLTAEYDASAKRIQIEGTVPAGETRTVTYTVTTKGNSESRDAQESATEYELNNYLTPTRTWPKVVNGAETTEEISAPEKCLEDDLTCTSHPIIAWSVAKSAAPASDASVHNGGTINYRIKVTKTDSTFAVEDVQVRDDLTEVLSKAHWAPEVDVPGQARERGVYFFDENGEETRRLVPDKTVDDIVPAPTFNETTQQWLLEPDAFTLAEGEESAEVWFTVRVGEAQEAPTEESTWEPGPVRQGDELFNYVSATSPTVAPNICDTDTISEHSDYDSSCITNHKIAAELFTIRKDVRVSGDPSGGMINMIGHEFALHHDENGEVGEPFNSYCSNGSEQGPGVTPPTGWEPDWDVNDPEAETCGWFYPTPSGGQEGRWRGEYIPAGVYWLVETKAPTHQRDADIGTITKVNGVQRLAEPIKFQIAAEDDPNTTIANGEPEHLREGQLDIFGEGTANNGFIDRCIPQSHLTEQPPACVNSTGFLMVVQDVKLSELPFTGGNGTAWILVGGFLLFATITGIAWRRRTRHAANTMNLNQVDPTSPKEK